MPRGKLPRRNLTPRKLTQDENNANLKHHRFAIEYLDCLDPGEAARRAGYSFKNEESAQAAGRRLLRNVRVMALIDNAKLQMAEEAKTTAEKTAKRFNLIYLEAMKKGDYGNAVAALRELGKFHGIYETHNKQKQYTQSDVGRLKSELRTMGVPLPPEPSVN